MPIQRRWALLAWGCVLAAIGCAPSAALAHDGVVHAAVSEGATERAVEATLGEDADPAGEGLYAVEGEGGETVVSHGPDLLRAMPSGSAGRGFAPGEPERAPVCAEDHYQRFFYARAEGAPDRYEEVKAQIQAAVRRMNAVLNTASLASGGGTADLRVLCDEAGEVRVDPLVSDEPITSLIAAIRRARLDAPGANNTVFYDGDASGACGIATITTDERLAPENVVNEGGGYAAVYGRCWFNEGPMHEMAHNMGAVQYGAPHSTGTGAHCYEEQDVVCYTPDGGDLNQGGAVDRCSGRIQFDCGADDYFDSAPEAGEYLSEHWNLGSPLNRFISFGERPVETAAAPVKLRLDRARSERAAQAGISREFWVRVPRHTRRLTITVRNPAGFDLDLYVGTSPSPGEEGHVCRSTSVSAVERCVLRRPHRGRLYAGVSTVLGDPGVPFRVKASA